MLYSEFIDGTGCRNNPHNYEVYKNLEVMYTNSDIPKSAIYEYGRKLVDNSKSPAEIAIEAEVNAEIDAIKAQIDWNKYLIAYRKNIGDSDMVKCYKAENKRLRNRIAALKWVIA